MEPETPEGDAAADGDHIELIRGSGDVLRGLGHADLELEQLRAILAGGGRPSTASSAQQEARKVAKVILCDPLNMALLSNFLLSRLPGRHG